MRSWVVVAGLIATTSGFGSESITAQIAGKPVHSVSPRVGVMVMGDFGMGANDWSGRVQYLGGRVAFGIPTGSLWVGGGTCDSRESGAERETTIGGGAALHVVNAPSSPYAVTLHVGAGTGAGDCRPGYSTLNFLAGPALRVRMPSAGLELEPWLMPRIHAYRFGFLNSSVTQVGLGVSGGVDISIAGGVGVTVAADWASFGREESPGLVAAARKPFLIGFGVHFAIATLSPGQHE